MLSPIAINFWLTLGAFLQVAAILWARRAPYAKWKAPLFVAGVVPLCAIAVVDSVSGPAITSGLAFFGPLAGAFLSSWALMTFCPPRISAAGVLSLSVTFWAAFWPGSGPLPVWAAYAALPTLVALVYAVSPWPPPFVLRLWMYLWFMAAAAALASIGLERNLLGAGLDSFPVPAARLAVVLTGAQFLLLMHAAVGVMMLVTTPGEKETWPDALERGAAFSAKIMRGFDSEHRPGWVGGLIVVAAQALALGALKRSGPGLQTETIRLAAFAAMAHGAMSGGPAPKPRAPVLGRSRPR